ncbi:MAG: hypothetical protein R3E89_03345 [Thiolinea sp.]
MPVTRAASGARHDQRGDLSNLRIVTLQFAHGFHSTPVEEHSPGARWRMNPAISGPTYVLGDLGTHCWHMMEMLTGLQAEALCCMRQASSDPCATGR